MLWSVLTVFLACGAKEINPNTITKEDLVTAVPKKDLGMLCSGLKSPDTELQQYAMEQLRIFDPKETSECIKTGLIDEGTHRFREGVLMGFRDEKRNAVASLATDFLMDSSIVNRDVAMGHLVLATAPIINSSILKVAQNSQDDPKVRAQAITAIGGYSDNFDAISELFEDSNPDVKSAVLEALARHQTEKAARVLIKEGMADSNEQIRAAATTAYGQHAGKNAEQLLCEAMKNDASAKVRAAAIKGLRKTESVTAIRCLREKAMTLEEDRDVRAALIDVLRMAQGDAEPAANAVLCDAIPFWLRSYVTDKLPEEDPETDIVKTQNDVDFQNSEKCFAAAYKQRKGYTCHAEKYISWFYKQVSNQESLYVPKCPGDEE